MTRTMLVASPGGHLDELRILIDLLGIDASDALWVTGKTSQTESLLEGEEVAWLPRVGSGEMRKAAFGLPTAIRLHRRFRPELLVTTGALFSTPTWWRRRCSAVRHGSSTVPRASTVRRTRGCSLAVSPGPSCSPRVAGGATNAGRTCRASSTPSRPCPGRRRSPPSTSARPSCRWARSCGPSSAPWTVLWSCCPRPTSTGRQESPRPSVRVAHCSKWVPAADLRQAFHESDVVLTHAGVGSALVALEGGAVPVILPRRQLHGEMIDDHQVEFADMMVRRSLAVSVDPDELSMEHILRAANLVARRRPPT